MRTSRISKDTAKAIAAASGTSRRTRSSNLQPQDTTTSPDIEDAIPSALKRKRTSNPNPSVRQTARKATKTSTSTKTEIKTEIETETLTSSLPKPRKERKPARNIKNPSTGEVEIHPPSNWRGIYDTVKTMRLSGAAQNAAVDTMGCDRLHLPEASPRDKRFHTLIALMLSSQTKDTTNAVVMRKLQTELPPYQPGAPVGLNLDNILTVEPKLLNELIWQVGFHNNKTKYIKAAAEILRDQWEGDVPGTIEGLMALPGVGPKMGYLCLSAAWGRTEGIGVDVHVHRITNLWGWCKTKNPEETRLSLQSWLPKEYWKEINWLLVGLGQTICLPIGHKCGDCALGLQGLCKAAERSKVIIGRKKIEEMVVKEEVEMAADLDSKEVVKKGEVVEEEEVVKEEEVQMKEVEMATSCKGYTYIYDPFDEFSSDDEEIIKQKEIDRKKVLAGEAIVGNPYLRSDAGLEGGGLAKEEEVVKKKVVVKAEEVAKEEEVVEKKSQRRKRWCK